MQFSRTDRDSAQSIAELVTATFSASEGAEEGALVGGLALRMITETPGEDLRVFGAWDDAVLVGSILFSRLAYDTGERGVFVMGPVAVATDRHRQGIGRGLITYGLSALREEGVDIAMTYGDPSYYGRLGFRPVREVDIPAPFRLKHPEGWLGQSLTESALTPIKGPARCVPAFNDPVFW